MSFPLSPVDSQEAQVNGIIYVWNAAKGAWRRKVGVGLSSDQAFNGNIIANSGATSTSTTTGAIQVTRGGGIGVTGNVNAGAFYSNNYFYANGSPIIVNANVSNFTSNIQGGSAGQLVYQRAAGITDFVTNGDIGKILASNGPGNMPIWVNLQELAVLNGSPYVAYLVYPNGQTAAADAGGETIYAIGSGFKPGISITVNAAPVVSASYISSGNVAFVTTPEAIGSYTLRAINPNRQYFDYNTIDFIGAGKPYFLNPAGYLNFVQEFLGFTQTLGVAGGYPPYTFAITRGALPDGMTLDSSSGTISGYAPDVEHPTSYNFTVQVTDSHSQTVTRDFYILVVVPLVLTNAMTIGTRGSDFLRAARANANASAYTINVSSIGSDFLKTAIATANASAYTVTMSSVGSDFLKAAIATANASSYSITVSSKYYNR